MASILNGISCIYGVSGTVTNLFVQSFSVSSGFNNEDTVQDENGVTKTHRLDDRKTTLSVDGICKTSSVPALGSVLTFTVNTNSSYPSGTASTTFTGVVVKVDEKSVNKGFCSVSVEAVDYEGISYV